MAIPSPLMTCVFSADRVRKKGSNLQTRIPADAKVVKVDDYTVDFILTSPNPILNSQWDTWYIMDKKWAEANNAVDPTPARRPHRVLRRSMPTAPAPSPSKAISPA